jgi:hypothetical protein
MEFTCAVRMEKVLQRDPLLPPPVKELIHEPRRELSSRAHRKYIFHESTHRRRN